MIRVCAAIIEKNDLVLAARRKPGKHLAGFWEFPGGKIEENETPEQCLLRELKEEFDIVAEIGDYIGISEYNYGEKHIQLFAYLAKHISGDFKLNDHDNIVWIRHNQFNELEWAPADIPLINSYLSRIKT